MSNAAIKKARMAAVLPKELDEVLSLLNARLRRLENNCSPTQPFPLE